ncbi:MAG: hypothetical protein AMJ64_07955 [Betaproteobacteria bacterium SG8_39]|nr:MAG: hypothetical protein AMJ64_07955 [Betaproteobacteria bacterium SG8_39]
MALNATLHHFKVQLADADRHLYQALEFKAARHPSESAAWLVARVLAYCLEYAEGIAFSRGLSEPDDPAIAVRDLTGALLSWIEVGLPDAARLHRAAKAAPRVAVYAHRDPTAWLRSLADERIHRAEALELVAFDRGLIDAFAERLERRMVFDLSVSDRHLYLSLGDVNVDGALTSLALTA